MPCVVPRGMPRIRQLYLPCRVRLCLGEYTVVLLPPAMGRKYYKKYQDASGCVKI
jgi:hypothetical protein